jgi:superfamily II DNA or RNA helicase
LLDRNMMGFSDWMGIRESVESTVTGPGIKALQAAMRDMASRGVPKEFNDYGFNKGDWTSYQSLLANGHIDSISVPVRAADLMLRMLSHYRNTQVPNYQQISSLVAKDMEAVRAGSSGDKAVVYDKQPLEYGKVKVYIPHGVDRSMTIQINRIVDAALEAEGAERSQDAYGNMKLPRFKKFSQDRTGMHTYRVHKGILPQIAQVIKSKGMDVEYESGSEPSLPASQQATPSKADEIEIIGEEKTDFGTKIAIRFNVPYERSKATFEAMKSKGLSPKGISYKPGPSRFLIDTDSANFRSVADELIRQGYDTTSLEKFAREKTTPTETPRSTSDVIKFTDDSGDKLRIRVNYRALDQGRKEFIKESIQYTFPDYEWNRADFYYTVSGNYKQYVNFGRLLKRFGYEVSELRDIVRAKLKDGRLQESVWEGKHDDDEEFASKIEDKLPESKFELYDAQKKGIAFLYGRDHAILGDATGVGKTIQLVSAAALRMQRDGKPVLVVTLKATQKQWVEEITNVVGDEEKSKISTDPLNPGKWTVLYYENFSSGKNLDQVVSKLSGTGFGIVIFDELHKVKHSKSKRSQNIAKVVEKIPTKWGASATVSSNKPMDVRNQLAMTGHHLGRVSEAKFKRDFAGMVGGGYGGSLQKSDSDEDEIRAAERLNKWLNLSGVYVRRSKEDIRDMPNLSVSNQGASIDQDKFQGIFSDRISGYKDPSLPISRLIAAREAVAQLKTDKTTAEVIRIVNEGKDKPPAASKTVVFSNFIAAGRQLAEKIDAALKKIDPKFHVLTYLSDTKKADREKVKSRFTNDPDAKVLVMSMKMGGTGIDFPNAAQHMVINDFDWTPESAEQSEGRIYRINTNHPVNIQYIVGSGLDRDLFDRVQKKREIAAIIQRYRKHYHDAEHDPEALKKIVDAQKEIKKIDKEMQAAVAAQIPGAEEAMSESFKDYLAVVEEYWPV